jgi:hypothetical protein
MGFEYLKHSDKTKLQMSISRKKWIKENKDKFNWNIRKGKSEPCELFKSYLTDNNINFISEYSPFEERFFSIDIALPDKMVAIEINGNQHYDKNGQHRSLLKNSFQFESG